MSPYLLAIVCIIYIIVGTQQCFDREEINNLQSQNTKLRDIAEKAISSLPDTAETWGVNLKKAQLQAELKQLKENGK